MQSKPLYRSDRRSPPIDINCTEDEGAYWVACSVMDAKLLTGLSLPEAKQKAIKMLDALREDIELAVSVLKKEE